MTALLAGVVWAGIVGWLLQRLLRQFRTHREASLGMPLAEGEPLPSVALIVPARNEIGNIGPCLSALAAQRGLTGGVSIVVVDDGSEDGTADAVAAMAQDDKRIRPVAAGGLPAGWMGKPHACWQGALRADAEWLCFVDADVRAMPDLVRTGLAAALDRNIDMLSLNPRQVVGSFWERLIIPAGLVLIGCVQDLRAAKRPGSTDIAVNGQVLLIRREAYFAVGGHAAVRGEICEDKALALRVRESGGEYRMLGAEHLARTRMYTSLDALWQGLAKNATEIIGDGPNTVAAATAAFVIGWAALLVPLLIVLTAAREASIAAFAGAALALLGSLALIGIHIGTTRYFRISPLFGVIFPIAYTAVAALAWHSFALCRAGHVTWKGRTYAIERKTAAGRP